MNKTIVALFGLSILIASCSSQSGMEKAIKERITENALGIDLKYKSDELTTLDTVTVKELIRDWFTINNDSGENEDTLIKKVAEMAERMENEKSGNWEVWKWKANRIKYLKSKSEDAVEYYVVKNKYSITNPLLKADQTLTRFFLISPENKVLADDNDENFGNGARDKTETVKYEIAIVKKDLGA